MRTMRLFGVLCAVVLCIAAPSGSTSSPAAKPKQPRVVHREERERRMPGASNGGGAFTPTTFEEQPARQQGNGPRHVPRPEQMQRGGSFDGDLRTLRENGAVRKRERPEREGPEVEPVQLTAPEATPSGVEAPQSLNAPAPDPNASFEGLDFATWGAGHPPDTNGDVGPNYFIQTVNTAIGIYNKTNGNRVAAFTFDTFMSQGQFGNLCDTDNFGDPVVVYDSFEDRWVISDFAFTLDSSDNVVNPPGSFQCFAVSKTGDPVTGGWNFYSINTTGGLGDYPKLGVWPDGIYLSVNMFDYAASGSFQNVRLYALNKMQMYAGAASVQVVSFDAPATEFTLLPSNARLQTGTPPPGSPNYFASVFNYLNVVSVWKMSVNWDDLDASALTGPFNSITATNWSQLTSDTVPSPGNQLDTLFPRLMVQNQYTNIGGIESLWDTHTVGASGTTSAQSAVRYYEVRVTGGAVAANATQAFTHNPDTTNRFMPSVAVDRAGNMAIGYSATSASLMPAIRYAGRLAGDPVNTITQTEKTLLAGTGTQSGNCGSTSCVRWGDYSAMTLDPDGCTFWYTSEYYQVSGLNDRTRIGAFAYPSCTPVVTAGSLQGTVKTSSATPIAGATVMLGSRLAVTDGNGNYSFSNLPAGTYPIETASSPGFVASAFNAIAIAGGATVTRDFVLNAAAQSGCLTDTAAADFIAGIVSNCDVTGAPGVVQLAKPSTADQQNASVTNSGFAFDATQWAGQTFTPAVTGQLTRVDIDLFCSGCSGTTPNLSVSIRATSGSTPVPTGSDIAVATIAGFSSGSGGLFSALFAAPPTLTAGTRYAVVVRPVSNPSAGTYAYVCSCTGQTLKTGTNPYLAGQRVTSANSGGAWTADTVSGGRDLGFVTYMQTGFASSGTFVSSAKDANPSPARSAAWGALSWNASTPAGTTVKFQAAASNSVAGPYTFVGPDGTSATYFNNGDSLAQFNGLRYLKYRIVMTTSNSGVTPTVNDVTVCFNNGPSTTAVTQALVGGGTRLQQLQNPDGGWYFRSTDTTCGVGPASCPNTIGTTGLGLLSDYDRAHDPSVLSDAIQAAQLMQALHNANPSRPPYSQDLEFLTALSAASGDPQYAALSASWFATVTSAYPDPTVRTDAQFASRNASGIRTVAVWDMASMIRAAKAAGNVAYATGVANRVIAREAEWKDTNPSHRWDQCADPAGCGPADNKQAFDYTLLGMGSMLWAIHDLPGFDAKIAEYRSWLLSQQDATGTWDAGDLEITAYVALGLGAVGGAGTAAANQAAVDFYIANELANGGWPFSITTQGVGREYPNVDSEIIRAIGTLYGTQPGQSVTVAPAQLATVTFDEVTLAGATTVVAQAVTAPVPFGYEIVNGLTYEVATTAENSGASTVCFGAALTSAIDGARILHLENGVFVDRTRTANCAATIGLATFAIARVDPNAIDRDAPMLNVSLSPSTLSPANNKMIPITATIDATDNADAAPVITLVSITFNGGDHGKQDVLDAAIGTDDRSFQLRAQKTGSGARVYSIVYRATDRSGNATEVTRTVTVP